MSFFVAVEHRALEVLPPRPPGEQISIHHDWVGRCVLKYYCLSLVYSLVFLCFDIFVCCRLRESGVLTLGRIVEGELVHLDRSLLMALVVRWRPETHTFHLPCGEIARTLQDVAYLLGLPIVGEAVGPFCPGSPRRRSMSDQPASASSRSFEDLVPIVYSTYLLYI